MDLLVEKIRQNINSTLAAMDWAAQSAGRKAGAVRLVVVTKTHPVEVVQAAIAAGARCLGENYPEDAAPKIQTIGPMDGLEWHMIGHLQSRKSGIVAEHFHMLQSLDSLRLAERLDRQLGDMRPEKRLPVLLEFNVGGEESKQGWSAQDENTWDALRPDVEHVLQLKHLEVRGVMTMPPWFENPEESRPFFVRLRRLQAFLQNHFPQEDFRELSMGTSVDYQTAVQEGATLVRIGQAILGARPKG